MKAIRFIILLLVSGICRIYAQEELDKWDNQFFVGNKVSWGNDKWRYSGELQSRFIDDFQELDRWYLEGVMTYQHSENWEVVPDFRFSVRPEFVEVRPGLGLIRKDLIGREETPNQQFVQQLKYQVDIGNSRTNHGLRYIMFYNNVLNKSLIASAIGGVFYSWKDNYKGLEFIRAGAALAYVINEQHSINFTYFTGSADTGDDWIFSGSFVVQLVINIRKDYKYVPAKYINF
ncbi:DUF2490 domain-containing protein [Carboxylicivirga sp. RSCT41]|uniref:DUF2490 domain-containing protein n=1 Tax=Carboxylicivirga agarovorans TaxID=3417570 RepID=UPI003D32856C